VYGGPSQELTALAPRNGKSDIVVTESMKAEQDGLPAPQRYGSAATIWLALTLSVLDGSIANVALPTIAGDLSAPAAEAVWVVNAYQLAIVISLLPMAALGEMVGFRRVFQAGIVVFTLGSLGCTFAHSLPMLAFARAVQGFGAAGIMSQNGALVRFTYPSRMLGTGLGLNALVASAGAALGPTVASGILAVGSWQWLFAVNVPIGIAAFLLGRRFLPDNPKSGSFDPIGTVLNAFMFGFGFIGIDLLTRGGNAWVGLAALLVGAGSGLLLVLHSRRQSQPIVPFDLLKSPVFSLSVATSIASFAAQMLAFVSLPFFFEGVLHRTQVETGLLMTPWPLAVGIGAPVAGRLADKVSAAVLSAAGLLVLCLGLALLAVLPGNASNVEIAWRMAICGLGFGFFQAPNNRSMLSAAPLERSGAAGGMLATARLTGQTVGAILAAISFRMAGHSEPIALTSAAVLAGLAAAASTARLYHPGGERSPKPAMAAHAP
jgi:DHA2 family multidrug resistance protein-like MFS transporter